MSILICFNFRTINSAGSADANITMVNRMAIGTNGAIAVGSYAATYGRETNFPVETANGMIISGNVGIGTTGPSTTLEVDGTVSYEPSATTSITAAGGITVTKGIMRVAGDGGAIDITADPQIVDGQEGQIVYIQGDNNTNTVKLDDGTGLALTSGISFTMGVGDIIALTFDVGDDVWYEISRANN